MASSVIYAPSTAYSVQEYDNYPYDDRRPKYTPYPSSRPLPQPAQQQQGHQIWAAPPPPSTISYQDPSIFVSPPPHGRYLADDPAFATDPNIDPEYWHIQTNAQSTTPFPSHSYSGLDVPHDFVVPHSGPVPNTSPHSYHEDTQPIYFISPSISSSSSASDSSASKSSNVRPPRSSVRNSDYAHERAPFRSNPPMEAQYTLPDGGQSQSYNGKHRPKRRSPHSAQPATDHAAGRAEAAGVPIIPSTVEKPADGAPRPLRSSMTVPSLPDVSEHPKDGRVRTSSRPTPPDLDSIDELDRTNPLGVNLHHKGPYEAVAAILNESNPIDSPVLRQQRAQQQVSSGTRHVRPSRHVKSEPNAMSLNLQPGQILSSSIYQPTQPSHFPHEFGQGTHPPSQDFRVPRKPVEYPAADYDTANVGSPLRRNQTLPAPSMARGTSGQFYQEPPPVTSEPPPYQRSHPADSNLHQRNLPQPLPIDNDPSRSSGRHRVSQISRQPDMSHNTGSPSQIAPVASVGHPEASPYLDQHFSRTLYLTNPDEAHHISDRRSHGPPFPTAPEMVHPTNERRSEQPRRIRHNSLYSGQPSLTVPRPTDSEDRRRRASRGSPSTTGRTPEQDSPRRYEPPSQTVAAINAQYVAKASSSSSSSRASSSLTPRHVPKRLVMPTPLANGVKSAPPTAPPTATISRGNAGRSGQGQVLRKRNSRVETRPQRPQSLPPQTVKGGIFSFFKFGKGSKPTVREVRFAEPPKAGMNEQRGRTREEPRKLSKRR